jgi:hypothetical protein
VSTRQLIRAYHRASRLLLDPKHALWPTGIAACIPDGLTESTAPAGKLSLSLRNLTMTHCSRTGLSMSPTQVQHRSVAAARSRPLTRQRQESEVRLHGSSIRCREQSRQIPVTRTARWRGLAQNPHVGSRSWKHLTMSNRSNGHRILVAISNRHLE